MSIETDIIQYIQTSEALLKAAFDRAERAEACAAEKSNKLDETVKLLKEASLIKEDISELSEKIRVEKEASAIQSRPPLGKPVSNEMNQGTVKKSADEALFNHFGLVYNTKSKR